MIITRRYIAQLKATGQSQQGFMPVASSNINKRRPSLKRHSRTQSKVQLITADRAKSLSFDFIHPTEVIEPKKDKSYLSYSESKSHHHHKRRSFHHPTPEDMQLNTSLDNVETKNISVVLPSDLALTQINEHLEFVRKISKSLQSYSMELRAATVQKSAMAYYHSKVNVERYMQRFPVLIRKQFYNLINIERCLVIVLIEICLLGKLDKLYKYVNDTIHKILEQHKRFTAEYGKLNSNESPKGSITKIKFKMKTPGLIIRAENYKIFEAFKMTMTSLEMNQSMRQLIKNLEPTDPKEFWYMVREFYAYHLCLKTLNKPILRPQYWQYVTCPEPYLPDTEGYTLVLDLDETLAHFNQQTNQVHIRPFVNQFLGIMSSYFQIVIFTAGMPDYAEYLISHIELNNTISYRLYRHHTSRIQVDKCIKDLQRLGRDLSHVILIDNLPHNFSKQPLNGIEIKSWYGDPEDNELKKIMKHMMNIYQTQCDVRNYIRENFPMA